MLYELSVCLRYLRPRRSRAYISANTVISILGLAVGVMTLIVVIAVMSGFARNLMERSIGLSSHIEITGGNRLVRDWREVRRRIESTPHVVAASPFVWGNLSVRIDNVSDTLFFRAVDPETVVRVSKLADYLVYFTCGRCRTVYSRDEYRRHVKDGIFTCGHSGCEFVGEDDHLLKSRLDLEEIETEVPYGGKTLVAPLVVGKVFCDGFDLKLGDLIEIGSAGIGAIGRRERVFSARITGIFRSGLAEEDAKLCFTSLRSGQMLQGMSDKDLVHGLSVRLDDIEYCDVVKRALNKELGSQIIEHDDGETSYYPFEVKTWKDLRMTLFRAIQQEKVIMFIIVALITAVAALNIISSLTMTVMHKRKEIGILRSMGARRRSITAIFALSGILIGVAGIAAGVLGGLLLSYNIDPVADWVSQVTGTTKLFSGDIFYLDRIPIDLSAKDIGITCMVALALSILASIYPAWKAATLDPVEVLRYE
jgi:lipoprotein-releasing system permease protein